MKLNNEKIPGKNIKTEISARLESTDLSGSTNSTETEHQGWKSKTLNVTLNTPYTQPDKLSALVELYEARTDNTPKVYTINHPTANAMKINQVMFFDNLITREDKTLNQWNIAFSLREVRSVQERKDEQIQTAIPADPTAKTTAESTVSEIAETAKGTIEKIVEAIDKALAP